jgi:hypothetical protein
MSDTKTVDTCGYPVSVMGVAWYTPEAWAQLAAMPEARIAKSYQDFVRTFERIVRECAAQGMQVDKLTIDVAKMTEWCHRHGYEVDHKGRATYGAMLTLARDNPEVMNRPPIDRTRSVQ